MSLFRSKAEQKLVDKGLDPARLPPGQYLTEKWPVLHAGTVPQTDLATWDFKVFGEVEEPLTLELRRAAGAAADGDHDRHPLRHALEPVRHVVPGRALARAREARAAQAERALRARALRSKGSPRTCRSRRSRTTTRWSRGRRTANRSSPTTAGRCASSSPRATSGRAPSGCAASSSSLQTSPGFWERYGYHNDADYWKEQRYSF